MVAARSRSSRIRFCSGVTTVGEEANGSEGPLGAEPGPG